MTKLSLTVSPVRPTKIFKTPCEKASIYLFGMPNDFGPRGDPKIITETLKFYANKHGIKKIFTPSCKKFNAEVVYSRNFCHKIRLRGGLMIHQGVFADGVVLTNKQEAFFIPSADCPTIVAIGEKIVITAHAGRDCLFDRQKIHIGKQSRKHGSVVDAVMEMFANTREKVENVKIFITCGIGPFNFPHPWDHKKYGQYNYQLINYIVSKYGRWCIGGVKLETGYINLKYLIASQFMEHGVSSYNISHDGINTFGDNYDRSLPFAWHSCARGKTPQEKKQRNGIFIIRNF